MFTDSQINIKDFEKYAITFYSPCKQVNKFLLCPKCVSARLHSFLQFPPAPDTLLICHRRIILEVSHFLFQIEKQKGSLFYFINLKNPHLHNYSKQDFLVHTTNLAIEILFFEKLALCLTGIKSVSLTRYGRARLALSISSDLHLDTKRIRPDPDENSSRIARFFSIRDVHTTILAMASNARNTIHLIPKYGGDTLSHACATSTDT